MDDQDGLRDSAADIIRNGTIAALASTGQDGPNACVVFYVWLGDSRFGFKSRRASEHMTNLSQDARAALVVYAHESTYASKVGVQLKGTVREARDVAEMDAIVERYSAEFDGAGKKLGSSAELLQADTASTFFVFDASWFRLIDEGPTGNRTMGAMGAW